MVFIPLVQFQRFFLKSMPRCIEAVLVAQHLINTYYAEFKFNFVNKHKYYILHSYVVAFLGGICAPKIKGILKGNIRKMHEDRCHLKLLVLESFTGAVLCVLLREDNLTILFTGNSIKIGGGKSGNIMTV